MTDTLTALELVNEKFDMLQAMAGTSYDTAMAAINALAQMADDLRPINEHITLDETEITVNAIDLTPPEVDDSALEVTIPADPEAPELIDDSTNLSDLPPFPTLTTSEVDPGNNIYSSALLTALRTKLYDDLVNGSTGIEPDVEDAIWRREEERSLQALEDALDMQASLWAEIGWDLPDGVLGARLQEPQLVHLHNRLTQSREISIKSAELALANTHFIISQSVGFETMLVQWANSVAQRVFDASKAVIDKELGSFRENVGVTVAERNSIFESAKVRMQYNLGKIQLYMGQLEGVKTKLQAEGIRVDAVAKAIGAKSDVFKATADFLIGRGGLDIKVLDTRLQQSLGNMNLLIHDKDTRARSFDANNQLRVQALDALGRLSSQLMAGIWSSVSAGATASSSSSSSEQDIHTYKEK